MTTYKLPSPQKTEFLPSSIYNALVRLRRNTFESYAPEDREIPRTDWNVDYWPKVRQSLETLFERLPATSNPEIKNATPNIEDDIEDFIDDLSGWIVKIWYDYVLEEDLNPRWEPMAESERSMIDGFLKRIEPYCEELPKEGLIKRNPDGGMVIARDGEWVPVPKEGFTMNLSEKDRELIASLKARGLTDFQAVMAKPIKFDADEFRRRVEEANRPFAEPKSILEEWTPGRAEIRTGELLPQFVEQLRIFKNSALLSLDVTSNMVRD